MHIGGTMGRLRTGMRPVHIAEILASTEAGTETGKGAGKDAGPEVGENTRTTEEPSA
jgi:hypothetical protein